jgi:hypothetical protein
MKLHGQGIHVSTDIWSYHKLTVEKKKLLL